MPTWTPNWTDVRFDQAAAEHAAAECERVARVVRDAAGRRSSMARSAMVDADGPWRDALIQGATQVQARSEAIEARLRALAAALRDASTRARADQRTRVVDRDQWTDEAKAEAAADLARAEEAVADSLSTQP